MKLYQAWQMTPGGGAILLGSFLGEAGRARAVRLCDDDSCVMTETEAVAVLRSRDDVDVWAERLEAPPSPPTDR